MENFVVAKLEEVIDAEKNVTHFSLMDDTAYVILHPAVINVVLLACNVNICYPPIFQSGGNFHISPTASTNCDHLCYDSGSVIICALGSRYKGYCTNIARTFFIDSDATQRQAYQVLLDAHIAAIDALKPGNKASAVYKAAYAVVEKEAPEFISNLTKSAGTGIGLEFCESGLSLNEKNERILKANMVLNVSLGFRNMQTNSSKAKSQNYSLWIADTVVINHDSPEVVTSLSSKAFTDVAYRIKARQPELTRQKKEEIAQPLAPPSERVSLVPPKKRELTGNIKQPRLTNICIYSRYGGCRRNLSGTLIAHFDRFSYSTSMSAEDVEIIFDNIMHAFFQAAQRKILLHFKLHNHIMVRNEKVSSVQFYTAVGIHGGGKTSAYDIDGIEEEQRQRSHITKVEMNFQSFVNSVNKHWRKPKLEGIGLEFDRPIKELSFQGCYNNNPAIFTPTSRCLVQLVESPL